MFLARALIRVLASSSLVRGKQEPLHDSSPGCCHILNDLLPNKISWPGDSTYEAQQSSYYSAGQAELRPQCRVAPTSATDVSTIVKTATRHRCQFAVKSGGHMAWKGASNTGGTGFTIDLQGLNTGIFLSEDRRTVSFDAGNRWRDVYRALAPYNLTTVGGRVGDVGVGGFLLGGGIGFLTAKHGFGSDNIVNYEVVLADGSIVNANMDDHADLHWALKLGSTNFGIVTRFDMITYPQGQAWGGSRFYAIKDASVLLKELVTFTEKLSVDPKGFQGLTLAWNPSQQNYIVWTLHAYLDPTPFPPSLWSDSGDAEPLIDTVGVKSLMSITEDFQEADMGKHGRSLWSSMTYKANAQFHLDLHRKGVELFESYNNCPGVHWAVGVQPLPRNVSEAASNLGGSPLTLSCDDGELWGMG
ncbi:FAD-binding domain-containing protein [Marasmius fiardii PR-910]|nr:FAD-binding domain-containing protein [Marasmius fiardii PR-910]